MPELNLGWLALVLLKTLAQQLASRLRCSSHLNRQTIRLECFRKLRTVRTILFLNTSSEQNEGRHEPQHRSVFLVDAVQREHGLGRVDADAFILGHGRLRSGLLTALILALDAVGPSTPTLLARWLRQGLPGYVKARVHLAELYTSCGRIAEAEHLLGPAVASGDPEACWRLADVLTANGRPLEAGVQMQAARLGFEKLLGNHLLAFADHGAEFYFGSGNDPAQAFSLANINVSNRPTRQAFEQAYAIAVGIGDPAAASDILASAGKRWGVSMASAMLNRMEAPA